MVLALRRCYLDRSVRDRLCFRIECGLIFKRLGLSWPFFSVVLLIKVRESLAGLSLQVMESVAACPKVHYFQVAPRRIRKLLFL